MLNCEQAQINGLALEDERLIADDESLFNTSTHTNYDNSEQFAL